MDLTGRTSLAQIEKNTKTDQIATNAYCNHIEQMMNKKYIPNGNGPVQYFKEMRTDQFEANALDEEGKVSDGQIIMCSKRAFTQ